MLDYQLITPIISIIKAGLTAQNITAGVKQAYQPTQQGTPSGPTVFVFKLFDHPYGFVGKQDKYDSQTGNMVHTETQTYESHFQISTLSTISPTSLTGLTSSDLANYVAAFLRSDSAKETLRSAGIGIERITEVRNPYFTNDREQNQASPSFDFVLTHKQVIITQVPAVQSVDYNIQRV